MVFIPDWLSLEDAKALLNSNFITALMGALAGAYAGARGAQIIAERSKARDYLLAQIKSTNAAVIISLSAFNAAVNLKKQHVQPMYEKFLRNRNEFRVNVQNVQATAQIPKAVPYEFIADLRTFMPPVAPIDTLKDLVFNKVALYGRAVALVAVIEQSFNHVQDAITKRDGLIQKFKNGELDKKLISNYYFGIAFPNGDVNQEYPDHMEAIHRYIDDIVFFSALLCKDLVAYGTQTHTEFTQKFGKGAPKINAVDFSDARLIGVIPSETAYADWINSFASKSDLVLS